MGQVGAGSSAPMPYAAACCLQPPRAGRVRLLVRCRDGGRRATWGLAARAAGRPPPPPPHSECLFSFFHLGSPVWGCALLAQHSLLLLLLLLLLLAACADGRCRHSQMFRV